MECPVCQVPSKSLCAACKKIVYCSKEHQKAHRKIHKEDCFPAVVQSHPILGQHLAATKDILPGETIFKEEPLILGPRSNLGQFHFICLGCCNSIPTASSIVPCHTCKWPMCSSECQKNPRHSLFECPVLAKGHVPPAKTQEEYLCITFLRCILLQEVDPSRWDKLLKFESHVETRKAKPICVEQSTFAIHFIRERCKLTHVKPQTIDFVYGIIIVNGYGDPSTFAVKLYSKAAKLSHACIPNTRTLLDSKGLEVIATTTIKAGSPLTQLYGRIFKGTHRRQELLQNVYYFSCACVRCKDPTELNTFFSAIRCPSKKCNQGFMIPKNPLDISPTNSKWKCNKCSNSASFLRSVVPALEEINKLAGTDENDGLYCEYEVYDESNPTMPAKGDHVYDIKLQHTLKMREVLKKLQNDVVHPNHYALLPIKTALIATLYQLLKETRLQKDVSSWNQLLQDFLKMVKELLEVVEVLLPGMTSERGLLLFYLSEGMRLSIQDNKLKDPILSQMQHQLKLLQAESLKIMSLDPPDDDHRKLVEANLTLSAHLKNNSS